MAALGVDPARSLITPACGTGRVSAGRERDLATRLTALTQLFRDRTETHTR